MKYIIVVLLLVCALAGGAWSLQSWNQAQAIAKSEAQNSQFNEDVNNLFYALQQYKERIGSYPVGNNGEIGKALLGNNSKNLIIVVGRKQNINTKGEFVDPWGTPFRIYFSGEGILIRSAGPNKRFDDSTVPNADDYYRSN